MRAPSTPIGLPRNEPVEKLRPARVEQLLGVGLGGRPATLAERAGELGVVANARDGSR